MINSQANHEDLLELGSITAKTQGRFPVGLPEVQGAGYYIDEGMQKDD